MVRPAGRRRSARFGCLERRWGVPLVDGGTYRLPRIVGLGRALDLILTGREIGADEAERIGFVDRLVPAGTALDAAVELAEEIAAFPWRCVVNDRRSVYEGLGLSVDDALANEDRHGREVIFADGFAAGVARFDEHQAERRGEAASGRRRDHHLRRLRRPRPPAHRAARVAGWQPGDLVVYRCEDCLDRWDVVVADEDDDTDGLD